MQPQVNLAEQTVFVACRGLLDYNSIFSAARDAWATAAGLSAANWLSFSCVVLSHADYLRSGEIISGLTIGIIPEPLVDHPAEPDPV